MSVAAAVPPIPHSPIPPTPMPFIDLQAQRRRLGGRIDEAIGRVLAHGAFIMGPEVGELERQLAAFCGVRHAIACASGTDALVMALMALGVGSGDAVFVPAFTFAATAESVVLVGATPVFVDVEAESFNLDPAALAAAIAATAAAGELRPKAVIPVDLFGQMARYDAILPLAERHGLTVLADAAQSFGATLDGARAGQVGRCSATSFFPAKPLGCYGDGGAIFTDDDGLAETLRSIRIHGQGRDKYENVRIGLNGRLDTLQAAILIEKLSIFEDELERRQAVADRYAQGLAGTCGVPHLGAGARSAWAQYTITVAARDRVAAQLGGAGIPTAVYYPIPLNRQQAYRACPVGPGGVPVSERLAQQVLSLPMHPYLEPAVQDRIIAAVIAAVRQG